MNDSRYTHTTDRFNWRGAVQSIERFNDWFDSPKNKWYIAALLVVAGAIGIGMAVFTR